MRNRYIPVLLIDSRRRCVKTVQFNDRTYIGDPLNIIRIFNEKEVDEICVLDIDATKENRTPNFKYIAELASECFMPLSYGGGIQTLAHCEKLSFIGVEKFILGHAARNESLLKEISGSLGVQSIVACVDVIKKNKEYRCVTVAGKQEVSLSLIEYCKLLEKSGVGEIIIQAVDLDGMRCGYDLNLIDLVAKELSIPLIALGGASDLHHLESAISSGASAAASGSAFTFIGRLRAVLINYPSYSLKNI